LEYVGLSDPYLRIAFWTGLISVVLIVVCLLRILFLRFNFLRKEKKKKRFVADWRPRMVQWIAGDEASPLFPIPKDQRLNFLLLWLHFHENLRGDSSDALNRLAARLGIEAFVTRLLRYGKPDQKLAAAAACGHLRMSGCDDRLCQYLGQRASGLSLTAARALCQISPATATGKVIPLMAERSDWPMAKVAAILNETGPDFLQHYIDMVESTFAERPEGLPRLLRILATVQLDQPLDLVRRILTGNQPPELTSAALRLVCHPSELPMVRNHLHDAHWAVRVQAVTKLGALGAAADIENVTSLLQDREWWVRYRAAQAAEQLSGLPARFRRIESELHDPFGVDMLHQVSAEADLRQPQRVIRMSPPDRGGSPSFGSPLLF